MSFSAYFSNIYTVLGLGGLAIACGFAWWAGGRPERLGTALFAVTWIGADMARSFMGSLVPTDTLLISDFIISAGLLYIAIRYSSLWLGAAMILQSFGFAMHAMQMTDDEAPRWKGFIVYLLINNVLSYLVLLTLVAGSLAALARRARGRGHDVKAPPTQPKVPLAAT